jgi:hypothetical protein
MKSYKVTNEKDASLTDDEIVVDENGARLVPEHIAELRRRRRAATDLAQKQKARRREKAKLARLARRKNTRHGR